MNDSIVVKSVEHRLSDIWNVYLRDGSLKIKVTVYLNIRGEYYPARINVRKSWRPWTNVEVKVSMDVPANLKEYADLATNAVLQEVVGISSKDQQRLDKMLGSE